MASIKLVKASKGMKPAAKAAAGAVISDFVLVDNQNSTCTVFGVDAAGNQVDISALATLSPAPTSGDTTIITVAAPTGMTFNMTATGKLSTPGTPVQITATATFNSGTPGPFSFSLPCDVIAGAAAGVVIVPGTPVAN
jgi:hypothetical protein